MFAESRITDNGDDNGSKDNDDEDAQSTYNPVPTV
jgi:hypothetical protein